ncbi:L,D-transpeptidase [Haliangium sp.]|uniref:L,D-transpeptidase n=1 Tax=Haliangium sp. TaxID=2663208 RepID=UPI003D1366E2
MDTRWWRWITAALALASGCGDGQGGHSVAVTETSRATAAGRRGPDTNAASSDITAPATAAAKPPAAPAPDPEPDCEQPALHFENGAQVGSLCPQEAARMGLTVVDLSDTWTPEIFQPGPLYQPPPSEPDDQPVPGADAEIAAELTAPIGDDTGAETDAETGAENPVEIDAPGYRDTYIALANERFDEAGADSEMAAADRYLELYGVFPSLTILHARFADDQRHACHDAVDVSALAEMSGVMWEERGTAGWDRVRAATQLRRALERQVERRGLADLDALAEINGYYRRSVDRLHRLEVVLGSIAAAEARLVCEGLLAERRRDEIFDWHTGDGLATLQRRHFVVARGQLDDATRAMLATDSRTLEVRDALRVLRERVVSGAGILADGSAGNHSAQVLGHPLDPESMDAVPGHEPLPEGAPDRVSAFTEVAARHLGWTDFASIRAFLDAHGPAAATGLRVALALPPLPEGYGEHMELRVEIDRGDVWYDLSPRWRPVDRRPALVVYAQVDGREVALVRWPTTIGGWQKERLSSGAVVNRFKESDVGPRLWRDMYAAPAWFPPATTPDDELVRRHWNGRYTLKLDNFGPGYRSAYGLAMFIHHNEWRTADDGTPIYGDRGIRTHGSANYQSIVRGVSHGCHRLFNHHALRLASFMLRHRNHHRHGAERRIYQRVVNQGGRHVITIKSRGYRYELVPPVPVMVERGTIRSRRKQPPH